MLVKNLLKIYFISFLIMGCTQPDSVLDIVGDYTSSHIGTLKMLEGGTFNNGRADMTVSSFRMGKYEITRAQFHAIMGVDPSDVFYSSGPNDPVQRVNWNHAISFCNKLSLAEGLNPVYSVSGIANWQTLEFSEIPTDFTDTWNGATANWSANGYRLPTEAEWEFAARGGNATHDYTYAGSNTLGDVAVFGFYTTQIGRTTNERTNPVGGKVANELGLFDMTGNVEEWCWDLYDVYPATAQVDYRGAASGNRRIKRGGAWNRSALDCFVTNREPAFLFQYLTVGFRVVRN